MTEITLAQITLTINLPPEYDRDKLVDIIDAIHELENGGDTVVLAAGPGPTLNSDGTPAAPARRGRKPNAEKAAAKAAAAEAAHAQTNAAHPAPPPPPPSSAPATAPFVPPPPPLPPQQAATPNVPPLPPMPGAPSGAIPPLTTPVPVPPAPVPAAPPPSAVPGSVMQQPAPIGPVDANGYPTYTKEQILDAVARIPGGGSLFFQRVTKPCGYSTVDAVPPEYYHWVMQELFKPVTVV